MLYVALEGKKFHNILLQDQYFNSYIKQNVFVHLSTNIKQQINSQELE